MRIGILHGGGTCPGANAAIAGTHRAEYTVPKKHPVELLCIPHGYKGLITSQEFLPLHTWMEKDYNILREKPGCILGTSRENPLKNWDESKARIEENIAHNRLDALLVIGGDDTLSIANRLHQEKIIPVNGVPKTIDYDLTIPSFGFHTAAHRGRSFVRDMRTEAQNFGSVGIIEAMGRDAGWLARGHQDPTDPEGSADIVLLPEFPVSEDAVIARVQEIMREKGHAVLVVAEGVRIDGQQIFLNANGEVDPHGHGHLGGVRFRIEQWLQLVGLRTMQCAPGYLYRSGPPTSEDMDFAYELGWTSLYHLLDGESGKIPTPDEHGYQLKLIDIATVHGGELVPSKLYDAELLQRRDVSS